MARTTAAAHDQTPVRSLLGRGSVYTVATVVQLAANIVVVPVVTRLVDVGSYGDIAGAVVVLQLATALAGLGLASTVAREFFAAGDRAVDHARRVVALGVGVAVVTVGAAMVIWWAVAAALGTQPPATLRLALLGAVPATALLGGQQVLRAQDRAGWFVVVTVVSVAGGLAAGLAFVLAGGGAEGYVGGLLLGGSVGALLCLVVSGVDLFRWPSRGRSSAALRVALPTAVHSAATYVLIGGDRLVLQQVLGADATGRYQVAYSVGSLAMIAVGAYNNAWAPLIFRQDLERRGAVLASTTAAVQRLVVYVAGGLAIGAPFALTLFAPPSYDPRALTGVVGVVALSVVPYVSYIASAHLIFRSGRTASLAVITPVVAVVNLATCWLLAERWGLAGAAVATLVAYIVQAVLVHRAAAALEPVPWDRRTAVLAAVAGAALVAVGVVLPRDGAGLGVRALLVVMLVVGLVREVRRAWR